MCEIVCFFKVIVGTSCDLVEEVKLCASASKNEADPIQKFLLGLQLVFIHEVLSES